VLEIVAEKKQGRLAGANFLRYPKPALPPILSHTSASRKFVGAAQDSTRIADPLKSSIRNLGSLRPAEKLRVTDSRTDTTISCVWTRRLPQGVCYAHFIDVFWLIALLAVSFGSLFIIINGLRKAPEAFEDEDGLHILPARPSGAGVLRNKKSPSKRRPRSRKTEPSLEFPVSHSS
jgi:hypothetical protein